MATYTINAKGSNIATWPNDIKAGDVLIINYSTSDLTWTVPKKGTYKIKAYGAKGGSGGGKGGSVEGIINLNAGDILTFRAYQTGTGGGAGGTGGNGKIQSKSTDAAGNGENGGSGGGGSIVKLNDIVILAGAGGGGRGGNGGGAGNKNTSIIAFGGIGGSGGDGGLTGTNGNCGSTGKEIYSGVAGGAGGVGGTSSSPYGSGGEGGIASDNFVGGNGTNGIAGSATYHGSGGGGGGGGVAYNYRDWYNAGGGGGGGGKGGDNYVDTTKFTSVVHGTGINSGDGYIEITVISIPVDKYLFQDGTEIKKYVMADPNGYTVDIVPTMTSSTTNGVTITASSKANNDPNYDGWKTFDDTDRYWMSDGPTMPQILSINFGEGNRKQIEKYTLKGDSYYIGNLNCYPRDWTFEGSNDGSTWTILHSQTGYSWSNHNLREFTFTNSNKYQYYRFKITKNNDIVYNNTATAIGEIQLMEKQQSGWVSVGVAPATKSMFDQHGMTDLSIIDHHAIQQLASDTPKLLMYTDDSNKTSATANLTAIPNGQLIFQEGDMDVSYGIESINITGSNIKIIVSTDSGTNWKFFDGASWQSIEADITSVKDNGMTPEMVNGITKEQWKDLLGNSTTLRFAYYLEQNDITDTVNVDNITITPLPYATETPTLDSIKITYDELSIEGRMQDLEIINAINMAKLQFKSNALLHSERYELHDLIIDTFESLDGIDTTNTTAKYDSNNKVFLYDTSTGAPSIQEVVLQEEILPEYRKKWMLYVEHEGNIDYEYSLDNGATWSPIIPFTMMDLTQQTGINLKVKAKLKDSTAKLRGIAFSWA